MNNNTEVVKQLAGRSNINDLLQKQIQELRAQNEAYVQTISYLSNELLQIRKRHNCDGKHACKKDKRKLKSNECHLPAKKSTSFVSTCSATVLSIRDAPMVLFTEQIEDTNKKIEFNMDSLPLEVFFCIFRYLQREDLDASELVCKRWHNFIKEKADKLPKRIMRSVKMIEKSNLTLTITSRRATKKYAYALGDVQERADVVFDTLKRFLVNAYIKRIIVCNLTLTDDFCRRFANCLKSLNFPEILRVEMLAPNLQNVSPDVFHKFLGGTLVASQYFIDGVRNAIDDHFSSSLFDQLALRNADEFTVYDVRSLDTEDVVLSVGDDALLSLIFGTSGMQRRNTLYLDSPDISPNFLANCLLKFVDCEDVDQVIYHVEFAHCHEQQVPTLRNITLEYEHNIQVEWSARNQKSGRVMEARVSRNGDDDDFCHITLSIQIE